jgi:surface antigen
MIAGAVCLFALVLVVQSSVDGAAGDKITIKDVMQKAMKGGLCGKVASGKASDEEKKQLVELFTALAAAKCPKGDADDWKTRTTALLDAAKGTDGKALKKAADCKGCHSTHK